MQQSAAVFLAVFRASSRAGAVFCLLLAALSLLVGVDEYPGYSQPALRWIAVEVLPLVFAGLFGVAALDGSAAGRQRAGLLAVAVNGELLARSLASFENGAPPFPFMVAAATSLVVMGTAGVALLRSHARL